MSWLGRLTGWFASLVDSQISNLRAERDAARQDLRAVVDSQNKLIDTLVAGQERHERRIEAQESRIDGLEAEVAKCHEERDAGKATLVLTQERVRELEERLKELEA